jgi:hypothetical protein
MPPQQDDIRIEPADDSNKSPVVIVNGKEVVVSSATEKPNRSLWVAWLYIFDVSHSIARPMEQCTKLLLSGIQVTIRLKKRNSYASLIAFCLRCAVSAFTSNGSTKMR